MGRRRSRLWRQTSLAVLIAAGMFLAVPVNSSGGREGDLKPRPSCASAAEESDLSAIIGSPDGGTYDCVGAPTRCREYM